MALESRKYHHSTQNRVLNCFVRFRKKSTFPLCFHFTNKKTGFRGNIRDKGGHEAASQGQITYFKVTILNVFLFFKNRQKMPVLLKDFKTSFCQKNYGKKSIKAVVYTLLTLRLRFRSNKIILFLIFLLCFLIIYLNLNQIESSPIFYSS